MPSEAQLIVRAIDKLTEAVKDVAKELVAARRERQQAGR